MSFITMVWWAFKQLKKRLAESVLTILGIGVATMVICILIGLFFGVHEEMNLYRTDELHRRFTIFAQKPSSAIFDFSEPLVEPSMPTAIKKKGITYADYKLLKTNLSDVDYISFFRPSKVIINTDEDITNIIAGNRGFFTLLGLSLVEGSLFIEEDIENENNVVVLGKDLKEKYFSDRSPLNRTITVNGSEYTVIGVVEKIGKLNEFGYDSFGDFNQMAYIPFFNQTTLTTIPLLDVISDPDANLISFNSQLNKFIYKHISKNTYVQASAIGLQEDKKALYSMVQAVSIFSLILLIIAAINVINLMIGRVMKRSKQIVMMKAIGATPFNLTIQNLLETGLLTVLGCFIGGSLTQLGIGKVISRLELPLVLSPGVLILGSIITLTISTVFSLYPAILATKIDVASIINKANEGGF